MSERLAQLVSEVQQYPSGIVREESVIGLVNLMLRGRSFFRPRQGQSLEGIYLALFQETQQQLRVSVDQKIDQYNPQFFPVKEWTISLCEEAFKEVLNQENCLEKLALKAQSHCCLTVDEKRYALTELVNAIRLSGKLSSQGKYPTDIYEDAVNKTLLFVCQKIDSYNPSRGKFMAWVNYRLDKILFSTWQEAQDPYIQSLRGKITRLKYQFTGLVKKTAKIDLNFWLRLKVKGLIVEGSVSSQVVLFLNNLWYLSQSIQTEELFKEMVRIECPDSLRVQERHSEVLAIDELAQPQEQPFLSEEIEQYIKSDPERLCQNHIRNYPAATFQALALARLEGKSWQEISSIFKIPLPTLNKFFLRQLNSLAPSIRSYIQS